MIALDKINADSSILVDYNLSYTAIVDTQVSAGAACPDC